MRLSSPNLQALLSPRACRKTVFYDGSGKRSTWPPWQGNRLILDRNPSQGALQDTTTTALGAPRWTKMAPKHKIRRSSIFETLFGLLGLDWPICALSSAILAATWPSNFADWHLNDRSLSSHSYLQALLSPRPFRSTVIYGGLGKLFEWLSLQIFASTWPLLHCDPSPKPPKAPPKWPQKPNDGPQMDPQTMRQSSNKSDGLLLWKPCLANLGPFFGLRGSHRR